MSHSCEESLNFEQWRQLASQDPDGFEAKRMEMIESVIEGASERCQRRLRGLQWRIDQVRDHSANPMDACISLSNMMWESFASEEGLVGTLNGHFVNEADSPTKGEVVPFSPAKD